MGDRINTKIKKEDKIDTIVRKMHKSDKFAVRNIKAVERFLKQEYGTLKNV